MYSRDRTLSVRFVAIALFCVLIGKGKQSVALPCMKYLFLGEVLAPSSANYKVSRRVVTPSSSKYQVPGFRLCKLTGKLLACFVMVCFYHIS